MLWNLPAKWQKKINTWNIPLLVQFWIFILVVLFFQLLWESFETEINTFPPLVNISDSIGDLLLTITLSILNSLFHTEIVRSGISLILPDGFYVSYFFYLSGIKQMSLVVILVILLPGPWKKKCWYLPACLAILLVTVFFRFILLTTHCLIYPEHFHLIQDMFFAPVFYFEILFMWLAWVLIIAKTASLRNYPERSKGN